MLAGLLQEFWKKQQNTTSYVSLKRALERSFPEESLWEKWKEDFEKFRHEILRQTWPDTMNNGANNIILSFNRPVSGRFSFDPKSSRVLDWIQAHGAEWVTNSTKQARDAMKSMIEQSFLNGWPADELARAIRPLIGLTKRQASANLNYYNHIKNSLLQNNRT